MSAPSFSLLTHILKLRHVGVLKRWLKFIGIRPDQFIVAVPRDDEIIGALNAVAEACRADLVLIHLDNPSDLKSNERPTLTDQFRSSRNLCCMLLKLDTVVHRDGQEDWLEKALARFEATPQAVFVTGTTRPYRADLATEDPNFCMTQRVSNNFMVIRRDWWIETQELYLDRAKTRFYVEGCIEWRCLDENLWGLRCLNRPDWRMLHVQVWDERLEGIQRSFEQGTALGPYLRGYEDDAIYEWERYYMSPVPSWPKRARIHAGRWRRDLLDRLSAALGK